MKKVGITVNQSKPKARELAGQLVQLLESRQCEVIVEPEVAQELGRSELGVQLEQFPHKVDLVFVLGGDGTLLGIARKFAAYHLPILGINVGHLGFLSEAEPSNLSYAVDRILTGDFYIEERVMITAELVRDGKVIEQDTALNDVGVAKGSFRRMITCEVRMNGMRLGTFSGDGVIVSTPTGSTAYSLSCGGPIVYPGVQTLLLTPICPHTLTSRPMVLPADSVLEVQVSALHQDMGLTIDGQLGYSLQAGDVVRVKRSPYHTLLIKWKERTFFEVLRKKLQGESN
ncbi:NAD(+)/NADH kinase [Hazenella coriacea]|uniref:NAD kinase n=1 Tax=Hazenella coriacea TaxID=1179467 RepID=A0A4R3LDJ9_9BACL|nr:NAD(+)/NADH kinase [Hazenella coriacea]TCS96374.1 NAD+ kinase [Hazenella coriacea]